MPSQKTNDQIILAQIIQDKCEESGGELSLSDYFEIYTASEILKDHDLTYDDISYGIVGDGGDGGIDSIYTFLNGELLKEDTEINVKQKKNHIEMVVIQSKTSASFGEDAMLKFSESAEDLFNLANKLEDYQERYNSELLDRSRLFRETYARLAGNFPRLDIKYYYATQGDTVHPNVDGKVEKLKNRILQMFGSANFRFSFIGASELLEMTRTVPSASRVLEVAENFGTTSGSYVCLVTLSKYFEFISDDGSLARSIFESNVRDYQGSVKVNKGIRKTLENLHSDNFWYLNNGVSIITPKAVLAGKQLTIEDPQIVNGLQTSHEIYQHFSEIDGNGNDDRALLVRVICEENEAARDRIIRATNSQTSIPPASLRSSDDIHRNIEDFLKSNGYYYDRKKNFYKNQGMPVAKIVSISYMAQAMMATTLLKPDSARARPSTLINSDAEYSKIFTVDLPIDIYLKVIKIMKAVEVYLKSDDNLTDRKTITNVKFYVAMMVSIEITGGKNNMATKLAAIPEINVSQEVLAKSLEAVLTEYNELGSTDQVAKGSELVKKLLNGVGWGFGNN